MQALDRHERKISSTRRSRPRCSTRKFRAGRRLRRSRAKRRHGARLRYIHRRELSSHTANRVDKTVAGCRTRDGFRKQIRTRYCAKGRICCPRRPRVAHRARLSKELGPFGLFTAGLDDVINIMVYIHHRGCKRVSSPRRSEPNADRAIAPGQRSGGQRPG